MQLFTELSRILSRHVDRLKYSEERATSRGSWDTCGRIVNVMRVLRDAMFTRCTVPAATLVAASNMRGAQSGSASDADCSPAAFRYTDAPNHSLDTRNKPAEALDSLHTFSSALDGCTTAESLRGFLRSGRVVSDVLDCFERGATYEAPRTWRWQERIVQERLDLLWLEFHVQASDVIEHGWYEYRIWDDIHRGGVRMQESHDWRPHLLLQRHLNGTLRNISVEPRGSTLAVLFDQLLPHHQLSVLHVARMFRALCLHFPVS